MWHRGHIEERSQSLELAETWLGSKHFVLRYLDKNWNDPIYSRKLELQLRDYFLIRPQGCQNTQCYVTYQLTMKKAHYGFIINCEMITIMRHSNTTYCNHCDHRLFWNRQSQVLGFSNLVKEQPKIVLCPLKDCQKIKLCGLWLTEKKRFSKCVPMNKHTATHL